RLTHLPWFGYFPATMPPMPLPRPALWSVSKQSLNRSSISHTSGSGKRQRSPRGGEMVRMRTISNQSKHDEREPRTDISQVELQLHGLRDAPRRCLHQLRREDRGADPRVQSRRDRRRAVLGRLPRGDRAILLHPTRALALAASGHVAAVPPTSVMKSRRFILIRSPRRRAPAKTKERRDRASSRS